MYINVEELRTKCNIALKEMDKLLFLNVIKIQAIYFSLVCYRAICDEFHLKLIKLSEKRHKSRDILCLCVSLQSYYVSTGRYTSILYRNLIVFARVAVRYNLHKNFIEIFTSIFQ